MKNNNFIELRNDALNTINGGAWSLVAKVAVWPVGARVSYFFFLSKGSRKDTVLIQSSLNSARFGLFTNLQLLFLKNSLFIVNVNLQN
ncbi:hypothetical protein A3SI_19471 [Nitritalea halalkaliphila LW7]|uniref:Uncharacterized protein n=1 Tax=Nitritalea halalkaliphila LW7 TaxID=1189621 RepID=I5BSN9_9BACT|nr:hypothetical protein A3SI_19471 [Nitritalea halalkaliphila LW7]